MHRNPIDPINPNIVLFKPSFRKTIADPDQDISFTTPLLSKNHHDLFKNKKSDEASTVEIYKKDRQTQSVARKRSTKQKENKPMGKVKPKNTLKAQKFTKDK